MNIQTEKGKVSVTEEGPEQGLTEEEIKAGIWNSPPAEKGQGRYLIQGKTIAPADFAALKAAGEVTYWDAEFLEECDMFFSSPGWRIFAGGLSILRERGYEIEIDTIEARKTRAAERQAQRAIEDARKVQEREMAKNRYLTEVSEYETFLGDPKWVDETDQKYRKGDQQHLKTIAWVGDDQYKKYSVTPAGYIYLFHHINSDWWTQAYSDQPAPAHVLAEAERIRSQEEEAQKKRAEEWEEAKKHRPYIHCVCPRCGRQTYITKAEADRNKSLRCAKCHTGKKATESTTVEFERRGEVEAQHIPEGAERRD